MKQATAHVQLERLYDMIKHLDSGTGEDFVLKTAEGVNKFSTKKVQAFVAKQIQASLTEGYTRLNTASGAKAIQAFTGTTDLAKIETSVWNALQEEPNYDTLWQMAFRTVPLAKGQLDWSIGNISSGVAFKLLAEGAKVEYAKITGSAVKGTVDLYGSGLEIDWKAMEGRDLAGFYNSMLDFRAKRMSEYSALFYGLLATAGALNPITWQGETTDTNLVRDIATLNLGYDTIGSACKNLGMGDTANVRMLVYCAPSLRPRINGAIRASQADLIKSGNQASGVLDINIEPLYTYTSEIGANKAIMVLPGHKIQNAIYMQEKSFERQNPDNLSFIKSSFTAVGGIIGEDAQTVELSLS